MTAIKKKRRQSQKKPQNASSAQTPSPGKLLKKAREAMGMEVATVAEQLHLSRVMVEALEEENYEILPARVFVRGYYRNFARLVGVPADVILKEFKQRCPEGEDCTVPPAVAQGVRKEIRSNHGLVRVATVLIVVALISVFGLWLKSYLDKKSEAVTANNEAQLVVEETTAPVTATTQQQVTISTEADTSVDNQAQQTTPPPEMVNTPEALAEPSVTEVSEPATEVVADENELPQVTLPQVQLSFSGDCWVDVRDSTRTYKLVGRRQAGEEHVLKGKPPYKMVLGNVRNARILVNGKEFDLAPYTKGNVAKLTFDPTKN